MPTDHNIFSASCVVVANEMEDLIPLVGTDMTTIGLACPYCGNTESPDGSIRIYICPRCGKMGWECCVPGDDTLCRDCENGEES